MSFGDWVHEKFSGGSWKAYEDGLIQSRDSARVKLADALSEMDVLKVNLEKSKSALAVSKGNNARAYDVLTSKDKMALGKRLEGARDALAGESA